MLNTSTRNWLTKYADIPVQLLAACVFPVLFFAGRNDRFYLLASSIPLAFLFAGAFKLPLRKQEFDTSNPFLGYLQKSFLQVPSWMGLMCMIVAVDSHGIQRFEWGTLGGTLIGLNIVMIVIARGLLKSDP